MKVFEVEFGDKFYFGGEIFGYVDIVFVLFYSWFYVFEKCGDFFVEVECFKIVVWGKRCVECDSVVVFLFEFEKVY